MIDIKRLSMGAVVSAVLAMGGSAAAGPNLSRVATGLAAAELVQTASFEGIRCEGDECLRYAVEDLVGIRCEGDECLRYAVEDLVGIRCEGDDCLYYAVEDLKGIRCEGDDCL